jgi:hypothetical protein
MATIREMLDKPAEQMGLQNAVGIDISAGGPGSGRHKVIENNPDTGKIRVVSTHKTREEAERKVGQLNRLLAPGMKPTYSVKTDRDVSQPSTLHELGRKNPWESIPSR